MNHTSYIKNLFYAFLKDDNTVSERVMLVKHYNALNLGLEDIEKLVGESYKKGLLYHRYTKNDIKEPYEPLVSGIRYYYQKLFSSEMTVSEFVDECNIYKLHRDIFVSYIQTGIAKRTEHGIISEGEYEAGRFMQSIINCLLYISKKTKILIVLDKFQLAGLSSMKIIRAMINSLNSYDIKILVIYNELQSTYDYVSKEFAKIVNSAEYKNILFEWESEEELDLTDYHAAFVPNKRFFGDYLQKLHNLYRMFAFDDARYYLNIIDTRITEEKLVISKEDRIEFYVINAMCHILQYNNNSALLICDKMNRLIDENTSLKIQYTYNYLCGIAQMMMTQSDLSHKFAVRCMEIADEMDDDNLRFTSEILANIIPFSGWKDVFSVDFNSVSVSEDFIKKLEERKFYNLLAYFTIFAYDNDIDSIKRFIQRGTSDTFEKAIAIGEALGNTNFLMSAYTKYVILFSDRGFIKNNDYFYEKKLKIVKNENDALRLAHFYMGAGYNYITSEQHAKANDYFCRALDLLYKKRDAEGLAEVLYNLTINSFCAQDYMSSCFYIEAIFKMLDNLDMDTISISNAPKLYGIQALSYSMIGNEYRCYKCENNMAVRLNHLIYPDAGEEPDTYYWNEDIFLYYFVDAIIAKHNNDYELAISNFEKAAIYFDKCGKTLFYVMVTFITEYHDILKKVGNNELADKVFEMGLDFCNNNGFVLKAQSLMHYAEGKNISVRPLSADFGNIGIEQIIELSAHVGKERKLVAKEKDIVFLSTLQETLSRDTIDKELMINNTMTSLQNNNNLDSVIFIGNYDGSPKILYKDLSREYNIDIDEIYEFFRHYKHEFIVGRTEKAFETEYSKIIKVFGKNVIISLVGVPIFDETGLKAVFLASVNMHKNFRRNRAFLPKDALIIIKTAIIQLSISIERITNRKNIIEMNEKLNSLAITDMLTGLYNRQGLAKKIEENYNCKDSVSILYADLDNFKYYNDTFGHDTGDVILVEFAKVFKKVSAKLGYSVRYGGDEFLVVLNNVSKEEVCNVADEIYETIKDGFIDVIREHLGKHIEIPKEKLISCSIGISTSDLTSDEGIAETLKKADEALYYMKKNHKGGYILWENLNEQKDN